MFRMIHSITLAAVLLGGAKADLALKPEDPASTVHPRKFGLPGGIGVTRGWYVWHKFDAKTWQAEVSHEGTGEKYKVRVLPWLTTYRHLAYGAHPDELLPGERVNLFFNPDDKQQRAYLVHFQDEICQMKGHNHAWQIEKLFDTGFTARVVDREKLDDKVHAFQFAPQCKFWSDGRKVKAANMKAGQRVYLTWCYEEKHRVVHFFSDAASLDAIQKEARERINIRVKKEGLTGFVEEVTKDKTRVLLFATWWQQAADLKPGAPLRLALAASHQGTDQITVKLVSRKNLGAYGSGCSELIIEASDVKHIEILRVWTGGKVIHVFGP